jgi:DNA-binding NtrC family response regulator
MEKETPREHLLSTHVTNFPNTVLVVDDEPVVTQVLAKILQIKGLTVKVAVSAEAAMEALRAESFGCLLTDKNLPGKDGLELIALVRKVQPHCACIVITGYASTHSAIEALRMGAVDYIEKPFPDIELVAEKVRLAIDHHRSVFERERLLRILRVLQEELSRSEQQVSQKRSEMEFFDALVDLRVKDMTHELQQKVRQLEEMVRKLRAGAT